MPILAAPLVIPFAEAIGLSVATLGIAKASDMVKEFIQKNPEQSMKIFQMIMPSQGIANALKNKSSEGDEEVSEDIDVEVEEKPKKLSGKEKGMRIREAIRRARGEKGLPARGNYSSPDAEGSAVDIRGSVIREVEDMGLADKDLKDNYDPDKPKFDYKKFIRRRKADGGAIGIEVLFEEKKPRQGLFMGGPALEGPALGIYNSMSAYNSFTDQEIANAIKEAGYELPTADSGTTPPGSTPGQTIGYQGGNDSPYAGQVVDQTDYGFNKKNYAPGEKLEINPAAFGVSFPDQPSGPKREGIINQAIDSFTSLPTRSLSSFASPTTGGNIVGPAEQGFMGQTLDIDPAGRTREEIRSLYDNYNRFTGRTSNFADVRQKGKAGQVLGSLVGAAAGVPFLGTAINYLSAMGGGDKSLQGKYTVDNAGFGSTGARDEFGLATFNKKDGFLGLKGNTTRNYTDRMNERLGELTDFFGSRIDDFDINNLTPNMLNEMSKINGFYTKQIQAYKQRLATENINNNTQDAIKAQAEAKKKEEAAFQAQLNETQRQQRMSDLQRVERAYREDTGGRGGSYATGESGQQSDGSYNDPFDPGGGEKDGGFIDGYNRRKYSQGGLATMFKEKR